MSNTRIERLQEMARVLAASGKFEDSTAVTRSLIFDGHPDAIEIFIDPGFTREIERLCRSSRKRGEV